jgi:uncharacterized protein YndB with AHSA1/START domain
MTTAPDPPDQGVLRLERTFKAQVEVVFEAWTSTQLLRRWWPAGPDWETPVAEVNARVGGRLRLVMRNPSGEEFGGGGEYIEISPPNRVVFTWTWDGHEEHRGTQLIEVELEERDDRTTRLVLTNRGLEDEEAKRLHREGCDLSFDNLERVLAA